MERELLLLRHGKSDWTQDLSDFRRPLKERGDRESTRVGVWLGRQDRVPDLVVASPAERAGQTARRVCAAMGYPADNIQWQESLYMPVMQDLLELVRRTEPGVSRLMLVGHNPGLESLMEELADAEVALPDNGKQLATATVAGLRLPGEWRELVPGSCRLLFRQRGKLLPEG